MKLVRHGNAQPVTLCEMTGQIDPVIGVATRQKSTEIDITLGGRGENAEYHLVFKDNEEAKDWCKKIEKKLK